MVFGGRERNLRGGTLKEERSYHGGREEDWCAEALSRAEETSGRGDDKPQLGIIYELGTRASERVPSGSAYTSRYTSEVNK